jgi:pyruvate formate lyase activating enzyme
MVSEVKVSEALVTNVQRFSTNDGPGIRTTVFLKGCPLRCSWCHNPECVNPFEEFYYIEMKCVRCGHCAEICPEGAITPPGPNGEPPVRDRNKCTRCMKCVNECIYGGLEGVGKPWTIDEIIKEVESDELFYKNSGGGMTLSGGEPLFQPEFTAELLRRAKEAGLHTCLDTSGFARWGNLEKVLPYVDLVLFDIKCMNPEKHWEVTGVSNEVILSNARKIAERGNKMRLRLPIIPGVNQEVEFIEEVAKFARELGDAVEGIDLLPFHNWAEGKYTQLDKRYAFEGVKSLNPEDVRDFEKILRSYGFEVSTGG